MLSMQLSKRFVQQIVLDGFAFVGILNNLLDCYKTSIAQMGVMNPLIVTEDNTVISGWQRTRAALELGMENVPCIVRQFENEDEILRCLIETNIRQRGRIDSNHSPERGKL